MDLVTDRSLTRRRQRATLAIVCLATMILCLDIAVANSALPSIARGLHAGLGGVQWVVDAYTLTLAAFVLSAGSTADRRGRRLVFIAGTVLFTCASLACALSGSILFLDFARGVQGLGAAMMFATALAILADAFPEPRERAGAMAAFGASIGASFTIGSVIGGGLTSWLGWRSVFYVNVPFGLIALLGAFAWVRESRDPHAHKLDLPGQAAAAAGMLLLILALLRGNPDGWGSTRTIAELAGALVMGIAFVAIEQRVDSPMLPLDMFKRRDFTAAQIAAFAISSTFFAIYLYITLYLQNVLHLSPLDAGLTYLPGTTLVFIVSGASARIAARIKPATLLAGGLAMIAGGLALLTIIGTDSSWTATQPGILLASLGTGIFNPTLAGLALGAGPPERSGVLAGTNDAARQGGIAVGVAAFGALVPGAAALGQGSAGAYVAGLHHALLLGAGVAIAGAVVTAALLRPRRAHSPRLSVVGSAPAAESA